jgi:hypothetical protein
MMDRNVGTAERDDATEVANNGFEAMQDMDCRTAGPSADTPTHRGQLA